MTYHSESAVAEDQEAKKQEYARSISFSLGGSLTGYRQQIRTVPDWFVTPDRQNLSSTFSALLFLLPKRP